MCGNWFTFKKREWKLSNINVFLQDLITEEREEYNIRQDLWIWFSDILWFRNSQTVSGSVLLVNSNWKCNSNEGQLKKNELKALQETWKQ